MILLLISRESADLYTVAEYACAGGVPTRMVRLPNVPAEALNTTLWGLRAAHTIKPHGDVYALMHKLGV